MKSDSAQPSEGLFYIRIVTPLLTRMIAHALPRFLYLHPQIKIVLRLRHREWPLDGNELAIAFASDIGDDAARVLGRIPCVTCASPEYLAQYGRPTHPSELEAFSCIGIFEHGATSVHSWFFHGRHGQHHVSPCGPLVTDCAEAAVVAAIHGAGFVHVPVIAADAELGNGLLERVLPDWNSNAGFVLLRVGTEIRDDVVEVFSRFIGDLLPVQAFGTGQFTKL